jgi:hypothetical protein
MITQASHPSFSATRLRAAGRPLQRLFSNSEVQKVSPLVSNMGIFFRQHFIFRFYDFKSIFFFDFF